MTKFNSHLKIVGCDPSLRNWGLAEATFDIKNNKLIIENLSVVIPELSKYKQVRQNSLDLESAFQLYQSTVTAFQGANAIFIEVPVGSQSARAMASYGICVGVLGSLRSNNSFFEVTATEVKMAGPGMKTATKKQMIDWAVAKHPEGIWPSYIEHGEVKISEAKAEHLADAIGAIYAGIRSNPFKQLMSLYYKESIK